MFLQETTRDTSGYMIAGYAIAFIVMGIYVVSLYLRNRNLNQDRAMLEEMDKQVVEPAPGQQKPKRVAKTVTKRARKKQP